ncbi:MAG: hypothetical protein HZB19_20120 [Chloroflexi bacterium]|nr:hypothetical protein [Chloroflexota bacterium]
MQKKLIVMILFHLCWGIALGLSISKYGLGVSTDATSYMFAGVNLADGRGLIGFDGAEYILWPPLYPMLIGLLHLTGLSAFAAAHVIQFTAFALLAYFSSILFLKIFPDDFPLALLAAFLLDTGAVVITTFDMAGTDYLFAVFPIALALLINEYAEIQKKTTLTLLALTASVAMLLRYIGYTLVLAGLLAVLVYSRGSRLKRTLRALYTGIFAIPPFLWMLNTWTATADGRRAPLSFDEYIRQFTVGFLGWFTPSAPPAKDLTFLHFLLVWGSIAFAIVLLILLARRVRVFTPLVASTLGFGLIYMAALFSNALVAYFNRLWGRFQLPVYVPLIVLFLVVIGTGLRYLCASNPRGHGVAMVFAVAFLLFAGTAQLQQTINLMKDSVSGVISENGINTKEWNENSVQRYWNEHVPDGEYLLFSNYPAGAAFHTWHEVYASPRRSGVYDENVIPLEDYKEYLFSPSAETYLLWIEPNVLEHIYLPEDFAEIAEIEVLIENEDGGVYRLKPIR